MLSKKVTKLWKGEYVSIRDYEAKAAIAKGGLQITHSNQVMYLWPDQIKQLKPSSKVFKSKTGGKDYQLIDIKFVPDDPRQEKLI